jgi:hypothetical protein
VQPEVRAGQWSAVREPLREKQKQMEEMSLGELLYCVLVEMQGDGELRQFLPRLFRGE